MIRQVRLSIEARRELKDAVAWYEGERAGLGMEFLAAVRQVISQVAANAEACGLVPAVSLRVPIQRARLERFPYAVVFVIRGVEARVIAVAHGRRRPAYWKARI